MAATSESTLVHIKKFLEKAAFSLGIHHPNWTTGNPDKETNCIPDTLDLSKNYLGQIPEGAIEKFTRGEFVQYKRRVESGEIDAAEATYGGFKLSKLQEGFDPRTYEKALPEVRQYWAEQLTFDRIRQFGDEQKLGGYLLLDVNSEQLIKTVLESCRAEDLLESTSEAEIKISARVLRECQRNNVFQLDMLLMHPKHGIVIFEVKFGKTTETEKQVRTHRRNLVNFIQKSFGGTQPLPLVTLVICYPNRQVGENTTAIDGQIHKIGLDHHQGQPAFNQRMEEILSSQSGSGENWFADPVFQQLFTLLVGYKAAKFICHVTSSLEIYRETDQQKPAKHLKGNKEVPSPFHPNGGMETIFLSPEQQRILENPIQHQIIWGAPGSGKTLLVMLTVLEWCQQDGQQDQQDGQQDQQDGQQDQQDGPGRVVVYVGSEELKLKYERFFQVYQEHGPFFRVFWRQPEIVYFSGIVDINSSLSNETNNLDDVAIDEGYWMDELRLADLFGGQIKGRRFFALTSHCKETLIAMQSFNPQPSNLASHELRMIFRGTTNIINEWKQHLYGGCGDQHTVAHQIVGSLVTKWKASTPEQLGARLEKDRKSVV